MAYQNYFAAKLATDIGTSDTSITLDTAPTIDSGRMVLEARNPTNREIIKFTGRSGATLTGVTRGEGGTSAKPHLKNALVENNLTADDIQDLYDAYDGFVATNNGGWTDLVATPTLTATNGNNSFDIAIPGDKTALLSKGMRLKIPRTGTTPTQSASFNGTTQYASKASPSGITFTDDFTCEAWVKLSSYTGMPAGIVSRRTDNSSGWMLRLSPDGSVEIIGQSGASYRRATSDLCVPLGKSVHIAATLNMSANTATIYLDGVATNVTMTASGTPSALAQSGNIEIGREANATSFLPGGISDVRVWSTVRTQAQIRDNMNQQLTGSETGLVGYWKLNGDFNDSTANSNHLTAQAGATATGSYSPFNTNAFAIIMSDPVYDSTNTTMTVQTANGYSIPNATLGAASYSSVKIPYGFPAEKSKWRVQSQLAVTITRNIGSTSNWYTVENFSFFVPKGAWIVGYDVSAGEQSSTASIQAYGVTLSSSTTTSTERDLSRGIIDRTSSTSASYDQFAASKPMDMSSWTPMYILMNVNAGAGSISVYINANNRDNTNFIASILYAECALL